MLCSYDTTTQQTNKYLRTCVCHLDFFTPPKLKVFYLKHARYDVGVVCIIAIKAGKVDVMGVYDINFTLWFRQRSYYSGQHSCCRVDLLNKNQN